MNSYLDLEIYLRQHTPEVYMADLRLRDANRHLKDTQSNIPVKLDMPLLQAPDLEEREHGRLLTSALFSEQMRGLLHSARKSLLPNQVIRLRLHLDSNDPALHLLRWEMLGDPVRPDVDLACCDDTLFSRYMESAADLPDILPFERQRALIVAASPAGLAANGLAPFDALALAQEAKAALGTIESQTIVSGGSLPLTLTTISQALRTGEGYSIFCLICHGQMINNKGYLWLEDQHGQARQVEATQLVRQIGTLSGRQPRLVVLASCQSAGDGGSRDASAFAALGPRLTQNGALAVLAMQGMVPIETARVMIPHFFRKLIEFNGEVDRALADARALMLDDESWWMPVLFLRRPDGRIWWGVGDAPTPSPPAPPVKRAARAARIFISYKRDVQRDERLMQHLRQGLSAVGHEVFIDQMMAVGAEWRKELARHIEGCDYLVALLSPEAALSEMVAEELSYAYSRFQETGKARILPVRVELDGWLPSQFDRRIDDLNYATWSSPADSAALLNNLCLAINERSELPALERPTMPMIFQEGRPLPSAEFLANLYIPDGAEDLESKFYIRRAANLLLDNELNKPRGQTIHIRADRQTGKTSLLIRGVQHARGRGDRIAQLELQSCSANDLVSLDAFLHYVARSVADCLDLDQTDVDRLWQGTRGPGDKLTRFFEQIVLPISGRLLLAIDDADKLLDYNFYSDVFSLLRVWHNKRASKDLWKQFYLLFAISSEPSLFIPNINESPFNVGTRIELTDFDRQQVAALSELYQAGLRKDEIYHLKDLLGGHPYLTRLALYTLVNRRYSWEKLVDRALADKAMSQDSPFRDHLRHYLWKINEQPELINELRRVLRKQSFTNEKYFERFVRAGLVVGSSTSNASFRCGLYEHFFRENLLS
jgi:hypothetical protein